MGTKVSPPNRPASALLEGDVVGTAARREPRYADVVRQGLLGSGLDEETLVVLGVGSLAGVDIAVCVSNRVDLEVV